ncbi:hypothetical protein [Flavobacterium sp. FlaQc-47]|uniref:hypothetical protein n=1 Tax=Flavobacterium sp. FlaQc-47 TaxID=3374180 RepID=UPI003757C7C6
MKKLIYLFSATLLVLTSCTDDYAIINQNGGTVVPETPIVPDTPVVPDVPVVVESNFVKKIIHTYKDGTTSTIDLVYDGNKIVSETDQGGYKTNYIYTGDLITRIEKQDANGQVYLFKEYNYEAGKLKYILRNEFGNYYKTELLYNSNNSIWFSEFTSDSNGTALESTGRTGTYILKEGNLIKNEQYLGSSQDVSTFEYDSKKSPKSNVLGYNLLVDNDFDQSVNNPITCINIGGLSNNLQTMTWTYNYEYNENGYATVRIEKIKKGDSIFVETTQYFY